jgi:hypothetical protein
MSRHDDALSKLAAVYRRTCDQGIVGIICDRLEEMGSRDSDVRDFYERPPASEVSYRFTLRAAYPWEETDPWTFGTDWIGPDQMIYDGCEPIPRPEEDDSLREVLAVWCERRGHVFKAEAIRAWRGFPNITRTAGNLWKEGTSVTMRTGTERFQSIPRCLRELKRRVVYEFSCSG